jgi:hypothetical protein
MSILLVVCVVWGLVKLKVDFWSDEYVLELALNDVVAWKGAGEHVGYKIADVPPGDRASAYLPAYVSKVNLTPWFRDVSSNNRVIVQEYTTGAGKLVDTRFRAINSQQVITIFKNDPTAILQRGKSLFQKWKIEVPVELESEGDDHNASYDPKKNTVFINPSNMYKHLSRSAVFSKVLAWRFISLWLMKPAIHCVRNYGQNMMIICS